MLRRIWSAIASWVRRLLGQDTPERRRRRASLSSVTETRPQANLPTLGDADYEFLFMQLLEGVAHGWPKERVSKFLVDLQGRISDEQWTNWLRRFGGRLLASPAPNNELATRMVRLGEINGEALGNTAYEIGMQLLLRETRQPIRVETSPPPPPVAAPIEEPEALEPQPVTLDELFDLLQQDRGLVEQLAAQLQIEATDPQAIIQELINKAVANNQIEPDTADGWFNLAVQQQSAGDAEGAIASYDRCLEFDPHAPAVWSNRGVALADLGRYEEAIATFEQVLQIEQTSHWAWNNRGQALAELERYDEAIASFQTGLNYIQPTTQPEGWGQLHRVLGNAYYEQGRKALYPHEYWRKAVAEYELALNALTPSASPLGHLQVLQDLIRVNLSLGEIERSQALGQQGLQLLELLIEQEKQSGIIGIPVAIQSIGFHQLTVNLALRSGQLTQALELAEKGKNLCFSWFLGDWNDQLPSPNWNEVQQLLNPSTAIIYWHLSPAALTTFILQPEAAQPILIGVTAPADGEELATGVQRLREFDNWLKDWNQQYEENRHLEQQQDGATSRWRDNLVEKLNNLAIVLNVPEIISEIPANINNLILIPHRDLHRLPLHTLFPERFTISYLPSAQMGLTLKRLGQISPPPSEPQSPRLLSVECANKQSGEALVYTQIEAAGITQMFDNSKRIEDAIATKERVVMALASGYSIFHYTGNASDRPKTPNQSALALANPNQLTLEDISRLYLNSYQLAYLSACETVVSGKSAIATELVGLVSGLISRGVTNIVSTLWTVEAISRALLTIEFYRLIKVGILPAAALKQAQQWLRALTYSELAQWYQDLAVQLAEYAPSISEYLTTEANILQGDTAKMSSSQPPFAHPYHWAAFTISGI